MKFLPESHVQCADSAHPLDALTQVVVLPGVVDALDHADDALAQHADAARRAQRLQTRTHVVLAPAVLVAAAAATIAVVVAPLGLTAAEVAAIQVVQLRPEDHPVQNAVPETKRVVHY